MTQKYPRPALIVALAFALAAFACSRETFLEVGDGTREECRFFVSDDTPLVLTADTIRYCAGLMTFEVVEFPAVGGAN